MKRILFLLAIFCTLQANAQPYSISFAGANLSSIKVENLTSGQIVNLNAGEVLLLSAATDIYEVNYIKSLGMKVYPNPMSDKSTLEILPPVTGDAIISICDITGKVLTQFNCYVENYNQKFSLSNIKNGFYVINIQGNGYQFSEKLLCNGISNGTPSIVRVSNNIQAVTKKKSTKDSKGFKAAFDMAYNTGERLKYTAFSGNNSTIMTSIPTADNTVTFTFTECKDGDNNYYPVVQINNQVWMAENLKTTKYKDGTTSIPYVTGNTTWVGLTTPAYCWYNENEASYKAIYGALYNYYTVITGNLCPIGWHVPTDAEWTTLSNYLGGESVACGKLKETGTNHFLSPNTGATNETGFTALPGGERAGGGAFYYIGDSGNWYTSTENFPGMVSLLTIRHDIINVVRGLSNRQAGFSVRCLKD